MRAANRVPPTRPAIVKAQPTRPTRPALDRPITYGRRAPWTDPGPYGQGPHANPIDFRVIPFLRLLGWIFSIAATLWLVFWFVA